LSSDFVALNVFIFCFIDKNKNKNAAEWTNGCFWKNGAKVTILWREKINEKFPYLDNKFLKVVDKTKLHPKKFYFAD
jgi:hypothetical protein